MSPLLRNILRGIVCCVLIFLTTGAGARLTGNTWEAAIEIAIAPMAAAGLSFLGYGTWDQAKFNGFSMPLNRPRQLRPW